jgi:nucleoside-diphosphate-sugar epimerase
MVGSAITRYLTKRGDDVLKAGREVVDLRDQLAVEVWLKQNRPEAIVFAAAKVGGIYANYARRSEEYKAIDPEMSGVNDIGLNCQIVIDEIRRIG